MKKLLILGNALLSLNAFGYCDNGHSLESAGDVYVNGSHAAAVKLDHGVTEDCLNVYATEQKALSFTNEKINIQPAKKECKFDLGCLFDVISGSCE